MCETLQHTHTHTHFWTKFSLKTNTVSNQNFAFMFFRYCGYSWRHTLHLHTWLFSTRWAYSDHSQRDKNFRQYINVKSTASFNYFDFFALYLSPQFTRIAYTSQLYVCMLTVHKDTAIEITLLLKCMDSICHELLKRQWQAAAAVEAAAVPWPRWLIVAHLLLAATQLCRSIPPGKYLPTIPGKYLAIKTRMMYCICYFFVWNESFSS